MNDPWWVAFSPEDVSNETIAEAFVGTKVECEKIIAAWLENSSESEFIMSRICVPMTRVYQKTTIEQEEIPS